TGAPDEVMRLAEAIAGCGWQPDPIWVLDLCWSQGSPYLLEINFLSCSAFYHCNLAPIVQEASRIAQDLWERDKP
ncbi:MAG TPA: hypothetical protein V6D04_03550, partial [Candidatus Obscuribacterales bacterium]